VSICRCKRVKYWRNWLKERERQQRYCFHFHFRNNLYSNSGNWLAGWLAALFAFLLKIRISCCSCSNLSLVAFEWTVFRQYRVIDDKKFQDGFERQIYYNSQTYRQQANRWMPNYHTRTGRIFIQYANFHFIYYYSAPRYLHNTNITCTRYLRVRQWHFYNQFISHRS